MEKITDIINAEKPLKPVITLLYNGKDASSDFSKYLSEIVYREYEDDESDELNITLNDNDGYFSGDWKPVKGDKITASVQFGCDVFELGCHTVDEISYNWLKAGATVEIRALSASISNSIRSNKKVNHSNKTLLQIAQTVAKNYGYQVLTGVENINVGACFQNNESDLQFLKRISKVYGYIFNVKDNKLSFIKIDEIKNGEALFNIKKSDIASLKLTDTVTKMYGKCKISYLDIKSKSVKTYTATGNSNLSDTLTVYKRCASFEEAKTIAEAALKNGNTEIAGRIEINKPNKLFMPGVNFELEETGRFSGKFHIKASEIRISQNGMTTSGDIGKC